MRIADLRWDFPNWDWRSERHGFGWRYRGTLACAEVVVHACAVHCGPSEDDFTTQWFVTEGQETVAFSTWWLRHCVPAMPTGGA